MRVYAYELKALVDTRAHTQYPHVPRRGSYKNTNCHVANYLEIVVEKYSVCERESMTEKDY